MADGEGPPATWSFCNATNSRLQSPEDSFATCPVRGDRYGPLDTASSAQPSRLMFPERSVRSRGERWRAGGAAVAPRLADTLSPDSDVG